MSLLVLYIGKCNISFFKDGKQTAGCTNFCTETRLRRPFSVQNSEHPAVCLPSLKRERTLIPQPRSLRTFKKREHEYTHGQKTYFIGSVGNSLM